MKNYLVEFIGALFFVFIIGMTVIEPGAGALAPIAIGLALMVMVYAGGPISGAHYNPAVTLAVFLRGKCPAKDVGPYIVSQIAAALVAAQLVLFLKNGAAVQVMNQDAVRALIVEIIGTFALAYVVLNVATSDKAAGNSYFGLAIGMTVTTCAFALGGISGGAFNPAVAVGITMMGLSTWGNLWLLLAGNFIGGALAAVVYKAVNAE